MAEKPSAPLSSELLARKGAASAQGFALADGGASSSRAKASYRWRVAAFATAIAVCVGVIAFVGAALIYGGSLVPEAAPPREAGERTVAPTVASDSATDHAAPREPPAAAERPDPDTVDPALGVATAGDAVAAPLRAAPGPVGDDAAPSPAAEGPAPRPGELPVAAATVGPVPTLAPPPPAPPSAPVKEESVSVAPRPPATHPPPLPRPRPRGLARAAYRIQIHALASDAAVRREWRRLRKRHGDLLSGLKLTVVPKRLGSGKKMVYRMQLGALSSRTQATTLCEKLRRKKVSCMVVR